MDTFPNEKFKYIDDFNNMYLISNYGRVVSKYKKRVKRDIFLVSNEDTNGYLIVGLVKDKVRSTKKIHRLVGEYFLDKPISDNLDIHHIDDNKLNNHYTNLEWIEREKHLHLNAEVFAKDFELIDPNGNYYKGRNIRRFCKENGLSDGTLNMVLKGERPHHKGWRKYDISSNRR